MITVRKANERGHFNFGWLDTYHTFSFDRYYDPSYMGFRSLRVINEDRVEPGHGFPTHSHHDMEIITYILEGALEHRDSMGNSSIIRPGDVQRMSAGIGVSHSEANPSRTDAVHLLQIWILPERTGLNTSYEQKFFAEDEKRDKFTRLASRDGRNGSVTVHQDVSLYASLLNNGSEVTYQMQPKRYAWLQVARGAVTVNGLDLGQGDGAAIGDEAKLIIAGKEQSEVLLFDLA